MKNMKEIKMRRVPQVVLYLLFAGCAFCAHASEQPNIILLMTDDQDYYDLGHHGNPDIETPTLDRFASEALTMHRFYVSPLCSPTRASLMTGRYHQRTGILHTSRGAARLAEDEVTIAELLKVAGYRTGIFGKWHLGDNYPSRPQDQGFEETFYHKSGGIGQPPDEEGNYWEPVIYHNGKREVHHRYCTDLFFDAAIEFIRQPSERPFFVYLPTNVPHGPFHVDKKYYQPFLDKGADEKTAKVYGMLKNLDENFDRLLKVLDESDLADNTLVIFMSDNGGSVKPGFQGDFRGNKGSIYEGGVRSPFFARWPNGFEIPRTIETIAAHIDILPTLAAAAGTELPIGLHVDGKNLLPLWRGESVEDLERRTLFMHFNKAIDQALYKCATSISQRYKLVLNPDSAFNTEFVPNRDKIKIELYDIIEDQSESENLTHKHPELVEQLLAAYEAWYASVKSSRDMQPGRIHIDHTIENPVILSRYQEGHHLFHDSRPEGWMLRIENTGLYRLSFEDSKKYPFSLGDFWKQHEKATAVIKWNGHILRSPLKRGSAYVDAFLAEGDGSLDVYFEVDNDGNTETVWECDIGIEYRNCFASHR